jgi:hypothetical protein
MEDTRHPVNTGPVCGICGRMADVAQEKTMLCARDALDLAATRYRSGSLDELVVVGAGLDPLWQGEVQQ